MIEINHPVWKDVKLDFHKIYQDYLNEETTIKKWMNDYYELIDPLVNIALEKYLEEILYPKIHNLEEMFLISSGIFKI